MKFVQLRLSISWCARCPSRVHQEMDKHKLARDLQDNQDNHDKQPLYISQPDKFKHSIRVIFRTAMNDGSNTNKTTPPTNTTKSPLRRPRPCPILPEKKDFAPAQNIFIHLLA